MNLYFSLKISFLAKNIRFKKVVFTEFLVILHSFLQRRAQHTDLSPSPENFEPVGSSGSQDGFNPLEVRPPDDDSETRDLLPAGVGLHQVAVQIAGGPDLVRDELSSHPELLLGRGEQDVAKPARDLAEAEGARAGRLVRGG